MTDPLLIILAIVPCLLIAAFIYSRDKYKKESYKHLTVAFLLGVLITFPLMELQKIAVDNGITESPNIGKMLFFTFIVIALSEELGKFLCVRLFAYPRDFFDEPLDGIVYSVMVSMGFASLENVLYADMYGYETTLLRAFTAVPAHACFAVIMGFYLGLSKFDAQNRLALTLKGLVYAILLHGIYDFFLLQQNIPALTMVSMAILSISIWLSIKMLIIRTEESRQLHQRPHFLESENLYLTKINSDDFDDIHQLHSDPEVMKYISDGIPQPREVMEPRMQKVIDNYDLHQGLGVWLAFKKSDDELIGWFCLTDVEDNWDEIQVGYRLFKEEWGQGYATEMSKRLLKHGFETLQLSRIIGITHPANIASQKVLQKAGLQLLRTDASYFEKKDLHVYFITKEIYENNPSQVSAS